MSDSKNGQNSKKHSKKSQKSKRKAKSPLLLETDQTEGLCPGRSSDTQVQGKQRKVKKLVKRSHTPETDLFASPVNTVNTVNPGMMNPMNMNMTSPVGNFSQPFPFGFQPNSQQSQMFPSTPTSTTQTDPPPWASQIMEDIKSMKVSTSKIEKTVNSIDLKVKDMEQTIGSLETKIIEVESSCTFLSKEYDRQRIELKEAKTAIKNLQKSCEDFENKANELTREKDRNNDKLLDLESRSMRENLVFYGIPETAATDGIQESCETQIKNVINNYMGINAENFIFDRVHRMGSDKARKPRAIVAKFHYFSEREAVRLKSYDADIKRKLREANLGVGIQRPQQTRDARRAMADIIKAEEEKRRKVRQNGNKLYVDDKLFKVYCDGKVIDPPQHMLSDRR